MNDHGLQRDSTAWLFYVKTSFILSVAAMMLGIYFMPVVLWVKGYLAMGTLFLVASSITLSKTLRDEHESRKLINRLSEVKTEKMLKEYDLDDHKVRV